MAQSYRLTEEQVANFNRDGYLIVPGHYSPELVDRVLAVALADQAIRSAGSMPDADGMESKIWITNSLTEDNVFTALVFSDRMVEPIKQLLSDELYHFHHKMMLKEPKVGGAWEWHQDYGYWYGDGFLFPDMISCMVAINRATKENGCLQVLRGSHLAGRVNHGGVGNQVGADVERVDHLATRLETVHVELEPGDALFFHCNTLHRSDQNRSDDPRWAFIGCYTGARNQAVKNNGHGANPVDHTLTDEQVLTVGAAHLAKLEHAAAE